MATTTITQAEPVREKLQPFVLPETAVKLRVHAAVTGKTQGEVIDELAASLPAVTMESGK